MVDRSVGRLLERLESLGVMEQTVMAFTSDHGLYLGEHGIFGKMLSDPDHDLRWLRSPLLREVTRVPLMIRVPGYAHRRVNA
jgi:arylsulfatase A-like enzyme